MDRASARNRLRRMVAADEAPTLDADEIEVALDDARRPDLYGLGPADDGWVGTYDLNAAAGALFRQKAAKVAGRDPFSADGASFDRGKAADRLLAMARSFEEASSVAGFLGGGDDVGDSQILGPLAGYTDPVPYIFNL